MTEQNSDVQEQDDGVDIEIVDDNQIDDTSGAQVEVDNFDPVHDRVEINDPKVQAKFNNLYKQVKMSDARNKMHLDMLERQQKQLDEFQSRFEQTDSAEVERTLQSRLQEARDEGDISKENKVLQEIVDFRVDNKLGAQAKAHPKPTLQQIDPEAQAVVQMAQQTDRSGNPVHGWIAADHPQHNSAVKMAMIMATQMNAEDGYIDIPTIINKVTESMTKNRTQAPENKGNNRGRDPMGSSNLTNGAPKSKIRLSQAELSIAQKLGVKPEAYAKWKR